MAEPPPKRPDSGPFSGSPMRRKMWLWIGLSVLLGFMVLRGMSTGGLGSGQLVPYSAFRVQLEAGNVTAVQVKGLELAGKARSAFTVVDPDGRQRSGIIAFRAELPPFGLDALGAKLDSEGVIVEVLPEGGGGWVLFLSSWLPFVVILGVGWWILRSVRGRSMGQGLLGSTKVRRYEVGTNKVTFTDVAGAKGPKRELSEIVDFLRDPTRFERLGGKMPRGLLLVGPPGTGKTLLARAMAGEAEVPFLTISGSEFMEMFVGVGAKRVRDLFEQAKKEQPCIVFIDEIDSIGRRRGTGLGGGHDEREQTLNQLLTLMDGFERNEAVILLAATNRPDVLDPALLRPGRFDRQVVVELPTMFERIEILRVHARGKPLGERVDLEQIAKQTPGFSGADLANLLNEAALIAARTEASEIEPEHVVEAKDKVLMGLERESLELSPDEIEILAYHEAGHTVVAATLGADGVQKVSIVPRGRALGATHQLPARDRYVYKQDELVDRIAILLGGRAAERLALDTATSGAADDLEKATQLARRMVMSWGMTERFRHLAIPGGPEETFLGYQLGKRPEVSDQTLREADEEVQRLLGDAEVRAREVLEERRDGFERIAQALIAREVLEGPEILALLAAPAG